ncbi:MAG: adenosylhomocysteinase [Candidatus Eiseniibacteriota bacterium]|nr:MAG: adenosylhomocysteinase [Candidatus Eisenbacteria bacterium]
MTIDVKDLTLNVAGRAKIEWADRNMPVLAAIRKRFAAEKPLKDTRISACLHVTSETANLVRTLMEGGAEVALCASNPLSTQDDVAASLVSDFGASVFAVKGEDKDLYYEHIRAALEIKPHITMDDGADLVSELHTRRKDLIPGVIGGTEETTTGVTRLRSLETNRVLAYPIIAVNDANTKHLFDNRYGTGQSTIDGILRCTNILLAGLSFVVCGYGWCGRGVAMRAKGLGANVIVTEVDPLRALEAVMDGYRVMPIAEAAVLGDVFVTLTGDVNVISTEHFQAMKDGAIVANSGHFNVELNLTGLEKMSTSKRKLRDMVVEYTLDGGKKICVLGDGRLINLAAGEGHPAVVMDMSFANQSLCVEFLVKNAGKLDKKVYPVPSDIDERIAKLKLDAMGIRIDTLTEEQRKYLSSWELGTA